MGGKVRQVLADGEHSERMKRRESFLLRFPDASGTDGHEKFQMRCITALIEYYGNSEDYLADYMDICDMLGQGYREEAFHLGFQNSNLCTLLAEFELREESDLYLWLQILERLLDSPGRGDKQKKRLALKIAEALKLSGIGAALCRLEGGRYAFYPATEPFLDRALVFDVLGWLDAYPKAREQYREALRLLLHGDRTRKAIDCLRLSLELFCKQRYQNEKSLENQFFPDRERAGRPGAVGRAAKSLHDPAHLLRQIQQRARQARRLGERRGGRFCALSDRQLSAPAAPLRPGDALTPNPKGPREQKFTRPFFHPPGGLFSRSSGAGSRAAGRSPAAWSHVRSCPPAGRGRRRRQRRWP